MKEDTPMSHFLAIVGPSGSGKSSLVKAGLIPAVLDGDLPGSENWYAIDLMPGTHPLDQLEIALLKVPPIKLTISANNWIGMHELSTRR